MTDLAVTLEMGPVFQALTVASCRIKASVAALRSHLHPDAFAALYERVSLAVELVRACRGLVAATADVVNDSDEGAGDGRLVVRIDLSDGAIGSVNALLDLDREMRSICKDHGVSVMPASFSDGLS